jgi:hypothetical protein
MCAFGCTLGVLAAVAQAQTLDAVQQIATEDGKQEMVRQAASMFLGSVYFTADGDNIVC